MTRIHAFVVVAVLGGSTLSAAQGPVPPGSAGTVTLTRTDYDRLLDLASRRPAGPATAPTAAALARADIRVRVDGAMARATMRVDGEVFRTGIAKVPLIQNATLLDARMDNRPLPVIAEGDMLVAFVSGPGAFSATLEAGSPVTAAPGRASFVLPVPRAGSATATIDVPGEQADVRVNAGVVLRRAGANGRTIVDVAVPTGRTIDVSWTTNESATPAPARDLRLLADVKSVVSIGDADVRLVSLISATVVQGQPGRIDVALPDGYDVVNVSGASLERFENTPGGAALHLIDPTARRHQFLLTLERPHPEGSFKLATGLPGIPAAQRETGEVAIDGPSTIEIAAPETPGLRRVDVRELDPALSSIARDAMLAGYRYQRTGDEPPALTVDVKRFANAPVLAAVAERAVVTTLVTTEGRALTEITMWVRNTAQAFMKVALPQGASIVSVEVAGAPAKPVEGTDGNRVPLLRPGFRPSGVYAVSYVYLHNGTPFLKKGDMQMSLPKMDVPIDVLEWELFVPEQFKVDRFGGNVIDASLMPASLIYGPAASHIVEVMNGGRAAGVAGGTPRVDPPVPMAGAGQIVGRVVDEGGGPLPGATVTVQNGIRQQSAITNLYGIYVISNVAAGPVTITAQLQGFIEARGTFPYSGAGTQQNLTLRIGGMTETVTVVAESPIVSAKSSSIEQRPKNERDAQPPSQNVQNLQRRASGVLPIRIDVPRTGSSHTFVKPLVIEEEPVVTFRYKRR